MSEQNMRSNMYTCIVFAIIDLSNVTFCGMQVNNFLHKSFMDLQIGIDNQIKAK